jgi:hypothetical protein
MIEANWFVPWYFWTSPEPGWDVKDGTDRLRFRFRQELVEACPRQLRADGMLCAFEELTKQSLRGQLPFRQWWTERCGGQGGEAKRFVFRAPSGPWDIPWELLLDALYDPANRRAVALVRALEARQRHMPRVSADPLRVLIIQGADGSARNVSLDLNRERLVVRQAWAGLARRVRDRVQEPAIEAARRDTLSGLIRNRKPHVLWFNGHGRASPSVGLEFQTTGPSAPGEWVSTQDFVELIVRSGHVPIYAVFLACESARGGTEQLPKLYAALHAVGVVGVMAMQAQIRDVSAIVLAREMFAQLAIGKPLEWAVCLAREELRALTRPGTDYHTLDWACPVVWSSARSLETVEWGANDSGPAQYQLACRALLRERVGGATGPNTWVPDADDARAQNWLAQPRIWLAGSPQEASDRNACLQGLQAVLNQTDRAPLTVELNMTDPEVALRTWVREVRDWLPREAAPPDLLKCLAYVQEATRAGWGRLCQLAASDQCGMLALLAPEGFDWDEWFVRPLLEVGNVLVLASHCPTALAPLDKWIVEGARAADRAAIDSAVREAPRLAKALAVLNAPLAIDLATVPEGDGPTRLSDWSQRDACLVTTDNRVLMTASARAAITEWLDATQRQRASVDMLRVFDLPELKLTLGDYEREIRLRLLLEAREEANALLEAAELCSLYHEQERPGAVLGVVRTLKNLARQLPPGGPRLIVAWAYLSDPNTLPQAGWWLRNASPQTILACAWQHRLRAEWHKSSVGTDHDKEKAIGELEQALRLLAEHPRPDDVTEQTWERQRRLYEQDLAWLLQYLRHDYPAAHRYYERLIASRAAGNGDRWDLSLAALLRNYADCVRSMGGDLTKCQRLLDQAEQIARRFPHNGLISEVLYDQAKLAEDRATLEWHGSRRRGADRRAEALLQRCAEAARAAHYVVMQAVVANRQLWRGQFDRNRWETVAADLEACADHGWALRALMTGRLRAARRLAAGGEPQPARRYLEQNQRDLARTPGFDSGADRFRVAATWAGLTVVPSGSDGPWKQFLRETRWASQWLSDQGLTDAVSLWKRVD